MLRVEQVVANLFGCGGRLCCVWDWHRDGSRQNGKGDQRRTIDSTTPLASIRRLIQRDERFFVFDQRAAVGLERTLGGGFTIEALASWLFDRELFQGASFTSGRTDVVEFDLGPALSLQLLWRR